MIRIPLRYSGKVFGHAQIDDDCEPLTHLGYYSVTLPRKLRSMATGRPDIILAMLKEDTELRQKCRPFVSILGTQVLLAHLVLRGRLADMILKSTQLEAHSEQIAHAISLPELRADMNEIRSAIGRIAYANGDCTDCRLSNLREL